MPSSSMVAMGGRWRLKETKEREEETEKEANERRHRDEHSDRRGLAGSQRGRRTSRSVHLGQPELEVAKKIQSNKTEITKRRRNQKKERELCDDHTTRAALSPCGALLRFGLLGAGLERSAEDNPLQREKKEERKADRKKRRRSQKTRKKKRQSGCAEDANAGRWWWPTAAMVHRT